MQSLTDGLYTENFFYGYPYDSVLVQRPPQFDYTGAVLTSQGAIVCDAVDFQMHYGSNETNPDAAMPYGGAISGNPYYMRFPVLGWEDAAGIFLTITTTEAAELSFDRAFSGYVHDRLVVTVNGMERASITDSAGYPWTRTTLTLPKGTSEIAIALVTAPYTGGVVREGVAQSSETRTELSRFFRITNLTITHVAALPVADNSAILLTADSSATAIGHVEVVSGGLLWTSDASLIVPAKVSGPLALVASSTWNIGTPEVGAEAALSLTAESSLSVAGTVQAHAVGDSAGFALDTRASLSAESTAPQAPVDRLRPLKRTAMRMKRPIIVGGRPTTARAVSETEVSTQLAGGFVVSKIDPFGPKNVVPAGSQLTHRWSSLDAYRDPISGELTRWHVSYDGRAFDPAAPFWTTPGAFRPFVGNFLMRSGAKIEQVRYPAVHFDAAHLDHLNIDLKASATAMTWVFVGSFTRFRGQLTDSLPILDYTADAPIDYAPTNEPAATRGDFRGWVDSGAPSTYLGLTSFGRQDPTTSRIAWSTGSGYDRTDRVVLADNTPTVLIYVLDGANSYVSVTPLVASEAGTAGTLISTLPRAALPVGASTKFTLGKSRNTPPFEGTFMTGSMSLLEVGYANRALSREQAQNLASFYAALYAPVTANQVGADYTGGRANAYTEQFVAYANNPESKLALITGDRAVVLNQYPSSAEGQATLEEFLRQGVPVVLCSHRDWSTFVAKLEEE